MKDSLLQGGSKREGGYLFSTAVLDYCNGYAWEKEYSKATINNYRWMCSSFLSAVEDKPITSINKEDLTRWRLYMKTKGYDKSSVNSYLYKFRRIMRYYSHLHLSISDSDIVIPKKRKPTPKFLTVDEIKRLIEHANPREKAIIALLYSTGLRVGEIEGIMKKHIRGDQLFIVGKGQKESELIIDAAAKYYIDLYLKTRSDTSPYLFYSRKGGSVTKSCIQQEIARIKSRAGIQSEVTPHIFRHSFATHMAQNGISAFHLQRLMRHDHISSTQIYVHLSGKDIKDAHKKYHNSLV